MIVLPETPVLGPPTTAVRTSYLVAEQADILWRRDVGRAGKPGEDDWEAPWLVDATHDFDRYVAERTGVVERFGVPREIHWYVSGEFYLGTVVVRHELIPGEVGGHVGYAVPRPWQGQGHATRMLALALQRCRDRGLEQALLTVDPANVASTKVVQRNGGVADGLNSEGEMRWWCPTGPA